ncbi:MAG: ABC transporter substrate-binding protein [Miltoncostaeaceae bacterium]
MSTAEDIRLDRDIASGEHEVWYTRCPVPTAFEVALAEGFFDEEFALSGIDWIPLAASDDPAVHQSHFSHRKAKSFRHGGNVPAIAARSRGADTKVIGVSWLRTPYTLLARPGSGIESVDDLRGKRLLVPRRRGAFIDFWAASTLRVYEVALAKVGLTLDDVEIVETEAGDDLIPTAGHADSRARLRWTLFNAYRIQRDVLTPLVRGEVDAVTSQATLSEQLQALTGAHLVFDQADQPALFDTVNNGAPDTITVSGQFLEDAPESVAGVLARILQGADWARRHPSEAEHLLADRIQISSALLRATYGDDIGAHLGVTLPDNTADVLRLQQDHLLRHGFITEAFDMDEWIAPGPLARAREILAEREVGHR